MPIYANSYSTTWKSRWRLFASSYPVPRNNQIWHHSCRVRIAPTIGTYSVIHFISHWKDDITEFHFTKRAWYLPNEAFCEPKSGKMDKRGATVIGGYSDYYCRGLFYANASFWFHFYSSVDSVVFFVSSEISLYWSYRLLAGYLQCKVRPTHCKVLM